MAPMEGRPEEVFSDDEQVRGVSGTVPPQSHGGGTRADTEPQQVLGSIFTISVVIFRIFKKKNCWCPQTTKVSLWG